MKIDFEKIDCSNPCVIAETACGHDGSYKKLIKLIKIAKRSSIKSIKFQIYKIEERSLPKTKEEKIFGKLLLSDNEWMDAVKFAHKNGLFVFADIFGYRSLKLAEKIKIDGYKIHSEDTLNFKFIEKAIKTNKIVMIGVGGSHRIEIRSLVDFLVNSDLNKKVVLMTGVQVFPTPLKSHSINEVTDLKNKYSKYNLKIGFSDHVQGGTEESYLLPLMALSAGAEVIEKHFTTNRKLKQTDYFSSLNDFELKIFQKKIEKFKNVLNPISQFSNNEKKYRKMFKKSPVVTVKKKIGDNIKPDEIIFKKNIKIGQSLNYTQIIKKKLNQNIDPNSVVSLENLQQKVGIVIVARMTSNRLLGKAIKKILGKEAIVCLIDRMKRIENSDDVILATSTDKSDDILVDIAIREKINFYRGSLDNVASRYYEAAKKFSLDQIVRVTGDAILCDDVMLQKAISSQISKGSDVTFIKNMPYGTAKEVFNFRTIEAISKYAKTPSNTEYLEWFLENSRNFKVGYIKSPYKFNKRIRLTLDFKEDLLQLNKIFSALKHLKGEFSLKDVLKYLDKNPKIIDINSHLNPKFKKEQINTELKI